MDWRGQLLGLGLSGDEVYHLDPPRLKRRIAPKLCIWLEYSSGLLAGKVASSWHRSRLGGGMPSTGLRWLSFVVSAMRSEGWLVSDRGTAIHGGNLVVS
jgi:hypothetical protein